MKRTKNYTIAINNGTFEICDILTSGLVSASENYNAEVKSNYTVQCFLCSDHITILIDTDLDHYYDHEDKCAEIIAVIENNKKNI